MTDTVDLVAPCYWCGCFHTWMHSGMKFESTNPGIVTLSSEMQFLIKVIYLASGVLLWWFRRSKVTFIHNPNVGFKMYCWKNFQLMVCMDTMCHSIGKWGKSLKNGDSLIRLIGSGLCLHFRLLHQLPGKIKKCTIVKVFLHLMKFSPMFNPKFGPKLFIIDIF